MTALLLIGALVLIVVAAELFTNAVEWAGYLLRLGTGATGSLLAALGTALPETVVVVVALLGGAAQSDRIAAGAVLGSSFLLLTLGGAVTGAAALARRDGRRLQAEASQVRRDLGTFLSAFGCAVASSLVDRPQRVVIGVLLLLLYAGYAGGTLREKGKEGRMPEPLHFVRWRTDPPPGAVVAIQLIVAVALLVVSSDLFVHGLQGAASSLGIDPLILAVIIVPFATELPEAANSAIWVHARDDGLALGNVFGAAAFQACILGFVGISFTSWDPKHLGAAGLISAGCAFGAGLYLLGVLRRGQAHGGWLLVAALPWVGYAAAALALHGRLG
ncbi:MAG TPA: sodium:calcium antiporter [Candidatus Binatia bacterium]|nr:sodium:calcium antiporter [Candidatus Binatia bacterium]